MDGEQSDSLGSLATLLAAVAQTPPVPPLAPGTEMAGRYLVLGVLGAGGMGVVYRARDLQLQRDVAIKLCSRVSPEEARRLMGEAVAMAQLAHPNVITVHEVGRFGEDLFVVMELVDGPTLRSWLAGGPRAWHEVVRLYLDAAAGLYAVHQAGLVHGDFKPDNVLLDADGRVRIVDFGLARVAEPTHAAEGRPGGTPRYTAPELMGGAYPSQRSDQFSFCVSLWESLVPCRRRPRDLFRILGRGLVTDPLERHTSMASLRRLLLERLQRRRTWMAVVAAVLAAFALAAAGVWVLRRAAALRAAAIERDFEQGRREWHEGNTRESLAYLAAALDGGVDRPAVRFLVARGLAQLEQRFVPLVPGGGAVTATAFTASGPRALVGTAGGDVIMYAPADGTLLRRFPGCAARVVALDVDENDERVVAACHDAGAKVWELDSGGLVANLAVNRGPVRGARFVGRSLLTWGDEGVARLWDPGGWELARYAHGGRVTAALPLPDGRVVTVGEDGAAKTWAADGKPLLVLRGGGRPILAADLDATGNHVATGGADGAARVFETPTGALVAVLEHHAPVRAVRFLPDGRLLTAADDGQVRLWDTASGKVERSFAGHTGPVTTLRVTADGARVVSGSEDTTVGVWDTATGRSIARLTGHRQPVVAIAVTPGGGLVLSGSQDGYARAWSVQPAEFTGVLPARETRYDAAWFAGSNRVVAVLEDGKVAIYRASAGGWAAAGAIPLPRHGPGRAAVSRDGTLYAEAWPTHVDLWDLRSGDEIVQLSTPRALAGVIFGGDGTTLLGYGDGGWIWSTRTGLLRAEMPSTGSPAVAASLAASGDVLILAHDDGTLTRWSARDGRRGPDPPAPPAATLALAHDPVGRLALGGDDGFAYVWDGFAREPRAMLGRHGAPVSAVRFSSDGALLFSLGRDRVMSVWDVRSGAKLHDVRVESAGDLDVSPDGARLLVREERGGVSFWDISSDLRPRPALARAIRCLVGLRPDENGRLETAPRAGCP